MKHKGLSARSTLMAVTAVLLLSLAAILWGITQADRRTSALGEFALERAMDAQRSRLDMVLSTFEWDLSEEAAYIAGTPEPTDAQLIDRWLPLLKGRYAIASVGLANERGDERTLTRGDATWTFTSSASEQGPAVVTSWPLIGLQAQATTHIGDSNDDPREAVWFSHALEDRHGEPVWSGNADTLDQRNDLFVSLLIRSDSMQGPYNILRFAMDPPTMMSSLMVRTPTFATIQLSARGRPYVTLDTSLTGRAWTEAIARWQEKRTHLPFTLRANGKPFMARIVPYSVNGSSFFTGTLIELGPIKVWTNDERFALWAALFLLVVLIVLLLMAFIRSRQADQQVRRQERQSRNQARELAKAIGEREILDREVHHRVKNNLQVVSSLLNLQAQRVMDTNARHEFTRGKRRIDSMALVHHKLYRQQDLRAIDLNVFLTDLSKAVSAMFEPQSRSVSTAVDTAGVRGDADTSIQLGMILCELLANCYQHAFPYATGGHIDIVVRHVESDLHRLVVKDNGKGIDPAAARDEQLGLEIVEALADQLDGSIVTRIVDGTTVDVLFRMPNKSIPVNRPQ